MCKSRCSALAFLLGSAPNGGEHTAEGPHHSMCSIVNSEKSFGYFKLNV